MVESCILCDKNIDLEHDLFVEGPKDEVGQVYFCYECSHTGSDER